MAADEEFDPRTIYILSQVAHISCKKDHHEILSAQYLKASKKDMKSSNLQLSFSFSNLMKSQKSMQYMCQSMLLILSWTRIQMIIQSAT
jgi:hypothetical protein